jgi:hypothetical protein
MEVLSTAIVLESYVVVGNGMSDRRLYPGRDSFESRVQEGSSQLLAVACSEKRPTSSPR